MSDRQWYIGNYLLPIRPVSDSQSKDPSSQPTIRANGTISINNLYYNTNREFVAEFYERPTYFSDSMIGFGSYTNMSCDFSGNIWTIVNNQYMKSLDPIGNMQIDRFTCNHVSGSIVASSVHLSGNNNMILSYSNGTLVKCNDNGLLISTYIPTDDVNDFKNITGMAYDYTTTGSYIYIMSSYGKIFYMDISKFGSGESPSYSPIITMPDYDYNVANSNKIYQSMFMYNGYLYIVKNYKTIIVINSSGSVIYSAEIDRYMMNVAYNSYLKRFYCILPDKYIHQYFPNLSGIELDQLMNELNKIYLPILDGDRNNRNVLIKEVSVSKKKNLNETRYEVTISAQVF